MDRKSFADSIDNGIGQFNAEASAIVDDEVPLFDVSEYPEQMREVLTECNKRIRMRCSFSETMLPRRLPRASAPA